MMGGNVIGAKFILHSVIGMHNGQGTTCWFPHRSSTLDVTELLAGALPQDPYFFLAAIGWKYLYLIAG